MDADKDDPDDYDRSGALLAAGSAAKQEKEQPSKGAFSMPSKPAGKGKREASGTQVGNLLVPQMIARLWNAQICWHLSQDSLIVALMRTSSLGFDTDFAA